MKQISKFTISLLVCLGAGAVGSLFTTANIPIWYASLNKPTFSPPNAVFAPVWTTIYILLATALFLVWRNNWQIRNPIWKKAQKPWNGWSQQFWAGSWQKQNIIALFAVQLILNILWSYFFFGLHDPGLAFFELIALWCSIVYLIINFFRVSKPAAWLLAPYLLWVTFAGCLNFSIWMLNK